MDARTLTPQCTLMVMPGHSKKQKLQEYSPNVPRWMPGQSRKLHAGVLPNVPCWMPGHKYVGSGSRMLVVPKLVHLEHKAVTRYVAFTGTYVEEWVVIAEWRWRS